MSYSTSKVTVRKIKSFDFPPKNIYENRYCNQNDFSILVCGGKRERNGEFVNSVFKLHGSQLEYYTSIPVARSGYKTAVMNSDLFVLFGYYEYDQLSGTAIKFRNKSKKWSKEKQLILPNKRFSACSFKNNLYVVYENRKCFVYNLKNKKWTQLSRIHEMRFDAPCTVFEGKIVVTGGKYSSSYRKSVEAYDHYENKWTYLPDMIEERHNHASVSIGNKLFVIGGYNTSNSELFDSCTRKFTLLRSTCSMALNNSVVQAIGIGNNIVIFSNTYGMWYNKTRVYSYDIINDHWCTLYVEDLKNLSGFSCVKYSSC